MSDRERRLYLRNAEIFAKLTWIVNSDPKFPDPNSPTPSAVKSPCVLRLKRLVLVANWRKLIPSSPLVFVMPNTPGLRSCYDKVGRLIYFGRMLDKIRLHASGQLPQRFESPGGNAKVSPEVDEQRRVSAAGTATVRVLSGAFIGRIDFDAIAWPVTSITGPSSK